MDASNFASGKVLVQDERPMAWETKEMGGHQRRWLC